MNKRGVVYPGLGEYRCEDYIGKENGVTYGNIITARGNGCARECGLAIITALKSERVANEVEKGLLIAEESR